MALLVALLTSMLLLVSCSGDGSRATGPTDATITVDCKQAIGNTYINNVDVDCHDDNSIDNTNNSQDNSKTETPPEPVPVS